VSLYPRYPAQLHHPAYLYEEPGQGLLHQPLALAQSAVPVQWPATTMQAGKGLETHSLADGGSDKGVSEATSTPALDEPSQGTIGDARHGKDHRALSAGLA
jgi:hypothetical protein